MVPPGGLSFVMMEEIEVMDEMDLGFLSVCDGVCSIPRCWP